MVLQTEIRQAVWRIKNVKYGKQSQTETSETEPEAMRLTGNCFSLSALLASDSDGFGKGGGREW